MDAVKQVSYEEHLAYCKRRALAYVEQGDLTQAFASMGSDLAAHPLTHNHSGVLLGTMLLMGGHLDTAEKMRTFIEGFR